ncbi:TetR/AcrR family transcriptional regulator OS=Streptomyces alboniger OX=132473 GN=CP975_14595 PE=4 SV=1 [Streptomyces alboniger]
MTCTLTLRSDDCQMEQNSALMRGLAMAVHGNPDLLKAFKAHLIEPEMAEFRRVLDRAIDIGEVRADSPAAQFMMHMMIGSLSLRRHTARRAAADADLLLSYIDAVVLPALCAPTT